MKKGLIFFIIVALILVLTGCPEPEPEPEPEPTGFYGEWQLMLIGDFDVVSTNYVYTFNENGTGSCTILGFPTGDGFTFTRTEEEITITGSEDEGLIEDTYVYSLNGSEMIWYYLSEPFYTFNR